MEADYRWLAQGTAKQLRAQTAAKRTSRTGGFDHGSGNQEGIQVTMKDATYKQIRSLFVEQGSVPPIDYTRMTEREYRRHKFEIDHGLTIALRKAVGQGEYFLKPVEQLSGTQLQVNRITTGKMAEAFNCTERKVHTVGWEVRTRRSWAKLMARNQKAAK
jgi:hypothetical protein